MLYGSWPRLGAEALLHGAWYLFQVWKNYLTRGFMISGKVLCVLDSLSRAGSIWLSVSGWSCPPDDSSSHPVSQLWFTVPCTKAGIQAGPWILGKTWPRLLSAWQGVGLALLCGLHSRAELCQAFLSVMLTQNKAIPQNRIFFCSFFQQPLFLVFCVTRNIEKNYHTYHLSDVYQSLFFDDKCIKNNKPLKYPLPSSMKDLWNQTLLDHFL